MWIPKNCWYSENIKLKRKLRNILALKWIFLNIHFQLGLKPPRLLSNRRWGKVKGIYQRKGKKKNNINKAAENSYITHEQNIWALATSLLCALCSLAVTSACACYWLFAQHITRALPCNSCSHEINEGSMQSLWAAMGSRASLESKALCERGEGHVQSVTFHLTLGD